MSTDVVDRGRAGTMNSEQLGSGPALIGAQVLEDMRIGSLVRGVAATAVAGMPVEGC